jgi:hypothetical protein
MAGDSVEYGPPWGAPNDPSYLDSVASEHDAVVGEPYEDADDDWPQWGDGILQGARLEPPSNYPSFNESGVGIRSRPSPLRGLGTPNPNGMTSDQIPSETVSEGWVNKGATGKLEETHIADSDPADDSQVFVQTSQVQRYKDQNNDRALLRTGPHQDVPRTSIKSRVVGQKVKEYSGGLRHYDMFPRQIDDIPRPFYYRTAGTGPNPYLLSNENQLRTPLQRTPPPDPSMGVVDSTLTGTGDYGYTSEEWGY